MKKQQQRSEFEVICPNPECHAVHDGLDFDQDGVYVCEECEESFLLTLEVNDDDMEYVTEVIK